MFEISDERSSVLTTFNSFIPTSDSLYAYKFGLSNGKPWFTYAGKSVKTFAGRGAPRVTSLGGQPGTGIVSIMILIPCELLSL